MTAVPLLIFLTVTAFTVGGVPLLGAVALGMGFDTFLRSAGVVELGFEQRLVGGVILGSVPTAGLLAGALVGRFSLPGPRRDCFARFSVVVAAATALSAVSVPRYLEAVLAKLVTADPLVLVGITVSVGSRVLFCGAVVATVCMLLDLLLELPARWCIEAGGGRELPIAGLTRTALPLLALLFLMNLFTGLFLAELSPLNLGGR